MKSVNLVGVVLIASMLASPAAEQVLAAGASQAQAPPTIFSMTGALTTPTGEPRTGDVLLIASLYNAADDPSALWTEQQLVTLSAGGFYALSVGATLPEGVPSNFFADGSGRWLGIAVQGEQEQPRVKLVSVPYAVKAADAGTLAGRTSSDFVLTTNLAESFRSVVKTTGTNVGAEGALAKFTGTGDTVTDANVFDVGGNIGIGTTSPGNALDVSGSLQLTRPGVASQYFSITPAVGGAETYFRNAGSSGGFLFRNVANNSTILNLADSGLVTVTNGLNVVGGNIGIGTASPAAALDVHGDVRFTRPGVPSQYFSITPAFGGAETYFRNVGSLGGFRFRNVADNSTILVLADSGLVTVTNGLTVTAGNVGIGTETPGAKLHVAGDVRVDGNIAAKYQDVAEWVETSAPIEAGTVVIVDPLEPNRVVPSATAYDTRVAGAVSAQPGLILGDRSDTKEMVAQSGRVRVKADATFGAIRIGDLLVTSSTAGHVMRSKPLKISGHLLHRPGTLVGKALEALPNGKGEILVLLTLQ